MKRQLSDFATPTSALIGLFVQVCLLSMFSLLVLEADATADAFLSRTLRENIVNTLGGDVLSLPSGSKVTLPIPGIVLFAGAICFLANAVTLGINRMRSSLSRYRSSELVLRNILWTLPLLGWSLLWIASSNFEGIASFAIGSVNLILALTLAGWLMGPVTGRKRVQVDETTSSSRRDWSWGIVLLGITLFTVTFFAMNRALWLNLRIPHGDSVMYEEHLWNITHGKGFRSYLDQGLFLGEHIQVVHLFLVPLYQLWPSHLLLELCETFALALGAIPTYLIARRRSKSTTAAAFLACAYLLYFPLHYLDIAIDFKTFRPISFGVPLILWAINALEQKHWKQMTLAFILALSCKEDYAIVIAPLGLWIIWNEWFNSRKNGESTQKKSLVLGISTAILATGYLMFVVKYAIPWFRSGETVHYARYFEAFGETPTEIVITMVTEPQLLFSELVTVGSVIYLLRMLVPLGVPLRGWSQLLVGAPLFVLLCLNNIAMQPPGPYHHFHAPLVPIIVWAACAAIGSTGENVNPARRAAWVFSCSLAASVLFGFSPLSVRFWDPGHEMFWRNQYVQDERSEQFQNVIEQLPPTSRVASTDYVHARLTHFERSYDYSDYPRAVANYEDRVPDDTEYIVIDRRHKYSIGRYDNLSQIRELQRNSEDWEVLPDRTSGYFIILKHRTSSAPAPE